MKNRSTAFYINGGAGRVIASIPALEKFRKENPDDDFIIVCEGGTEFYKGHSDLDKRAYDVWHKNLFLDKIKDRNSVSPEPYRVWHYYNQQASLAQCFDMLINNHDEPRTLQKPNLRLSREEILNGEITLNEVKEITKKDKVVILQPFGRGVSYRDGVFNDSTSRSIEFSDLVKVIKQLHNKGCAVMIMAEMQIDFSNNDIKVPIPTPSGISLRQWAGLIKGAEYFIGCDSVGQHIAYAVETPATVITGSTFPVNISHPDEPTFDIVDLGEKDREYAPIRITPDEVCDRMNDGIMEMSSSDVETVVKSIQQGMKKYPKKNFAIKEKAKLKGEEQQGGQVCPTHGVVHTPGDGYHDAPSQPNVMQPGITAPSSTSQFGIAPPFASTMNPKSTKE